MASQLHGNDSKAEPKTFLAGSRITADGIEDDDDMDARQLADLGKKQVLQRRFGFWSLFGLCLSSTTTWEGTLLIFLFPLLNGGTAGVVYEYLFTWIGYVCLITSLAEVASMAPIAGAQYHWVYMVSPPRWRKLLSYITGWTTVLAWQSIVASGGYLGGTLLQGLLVLKYPTYDPQRWQGTLLMYAILVLPVIINVFFARLLPKAEGLILILHFVFWPAIIIPLVVKGPHSSTAEVFDGLVHGGGYASAGLTFLVGSSGAVLAFIGADAPCHMSEETTNASRNVPLAMVSTVIVNGALGFATVFAVIFQIGDVKAALHSRTGYPFMEIFQQAVNSRNGAAAMASFILVTIIFGTMSVLAAGSRMTWAFARDQGLPGSRWLSRVDPATKLPLHSIFVTVVVAVALAPINIGSTETFNSLVSLSVSGSLGSFVVPLALVMYKRITEPGSLPRGRFSLGWLSWPVNVIGICWSIVAMFFTFWPGSVPVRNASSMNWSCLIFGAVTIFACVYYAVYARFHYQGPVVETDLGDKDTPGAY